MTDVLFGGRRENNDFRNGFRFTGGVWLNDQRTFGLEGDFFFLGQSRTTFTAAGNGTPILSRPFFNTLTGAPDAQLVSFPGVVAGKLQIATQSNVIGGGLNAVHNLCCTQTCRLDLLYGYRYFELTDSVTVRESLTTLAGQTLVPPGFQFQISDRFKTQNQFNGGVIGLSGENRVGILFFGARASVALGATREITDIAGTTLLVPPGVPPTALPGGLLTLPPNAGHNDRSMFAVMPEVGLRMGVQMTNYARMYVGYNYLYLSNVARAGDQIDLRVNPNLLPPGTAQPGPALPAFTPKTTDFWMQGINVGCEFRF
jgi:hypothetical protein